VEHDHRWRKFRIDVVLEHQNLRHGSKTPFWSLPILSQHVSHTAIQFSTLRTSLSFNLASVLSNPCMFVVSSSLHALSLCVLLDKSQSSYLHVLHLLRESGTLDRCNLGGGTSSRGLLLEGCGILG
jgi:hypothetical protein